jgi:hypothetical protein
MKPLQRYEMVTFENWSRDNEHFDSYTEHQPSDNGNWVKWEDVKKLEKQNKIMLDAIKKAVSYPDDYHWRIINELLEKTQQEVEGEKE